MLWVPGPRGRRSAAVILAATRRPVHRRGRCDRRRGGRASDVQQHYRSAAPRAPCDGTLRRRRSVWSRTCAGTDREATEPGTRTARTTCQNGGSCLDGVCVSSRQPDADSVTRAGGVGGCTATEAHVARDGGADLDAPSRGSRPPRAREWVRHAPRPARARWGAARRRARRAREAAASPARSAKALRAARAPTLRDRGARRREERRARRTRPRRRVRRRGLLPSAARTHDGATRRGRRTVRRWRRTPTSRPPTSDDCASPRWRVGHACVCHATDGRGMALAGTVICP